MTDIATIGIAVDSTDVPKAASDLDKLAAAGGKAEAATGKLTTLFATLNAAVDKVASNTGQMVQQLAAMNAKNDQASTSLASMVARLDQVAAGQAAAGVAADHTAGSLAAVATSGQGAVAALANITSEGAQAAAGLKSVSSAAIASDLNGASAGLAEIARQETQVAAQAAPAIAKMRETERAAKGMGVSVAQTNAALRQLPAQMTDIVTQLAGGQNPLLILIQQGGQIKDSFGGIKPTLQALLALLSPAAVAIFGTVAAVGALAVATYQGSQETTEFNKQLILTGHVAGVTAGQLSSMAKSIGDAVGTQGKAADVLSELVATGVIARSEMAGVAKSIVGMSTVGGPAVKDLVAQFAELGREPASASLKLNERMHYLTASVYEQIAALEESGRKDEAAALAQRTLASALEQRSKDVEKSLGLIERKWNSLAKEAKKAWDEMVGLGREDTLSDQLQRVQNMIATKQASIGNLKGTRAGEIVQGELAQLKAEQSKLLASKQREDNAAADKAARQAIQDAGASAVKTLNSQRESLLKGSDRVNNELKKYRDNLDKIRAASPSSPLLNPKLIAEDENSIRDKYADKSGDSKAREEAAARLAADLSRIQRNAQTAARGMADAERLMDATRSAGGLADAEYFAKKRKYLEDDAALQVKALQDENARLAQEKSGGKEEIEHQRKIAENLAKITQIRQEAVSAGKLLALQELQAANSLAAAYQQAKNAAEDYLNTMRKSLNREAAAVNMPEEAKRIATGRNQIDDKYDSDLLAAKRRRAELEATKLPNGGNAFNDDERKRYEDQIKLITQTRDEAVRLWEEGYGRIKAAEMDWSAGASKAFQDYADNAAKAGRFGADAVTGGLQRAEDAVVRFAKTGKLSFRDLFTYMADEYLRQQARMAVSKGASGVLGIVGSVAGAFFGGNTGAAAGLASFAGGDSLDNMLALTNNFANREIGGPVSAGRMYQVNERGDPEILSAGNKQFLMMGRNGGNVSPLRASLNAASGSGGGGDVAISVVVNVAADGGSSTEVSASNNEALARQLGSQMALKAREAIAKEMRQGGLLWKMKMGQA